MINYTKINQETYNKISKTWQSKREHPWGPVKEFLSEQENKSKLKLLDLGCGSGRHLELAKRLKFKIEHLTGADLSENLLKITKEKGFKIIQTELINLPFKDKSFNIIICIAAHHHLLKKKDQLLALTEMQRILKSEGKLLLVNWFPEKAYVKKELKKGKFKFIDTKKQKVKVTFTDLTTHLTSNTFDRYYYLFKEEELIKLCEKANLKILNKKFDSGNIYLELTK